MVRLATTIATIALISVPAIAVSTDNYERDVSEGDIFDREIHEELQFVRRAIEQQYGREVVDAMERRDPFLGALFGIIAKVATKVIPKIATKVIPKIASKVGSKAAKHAVKHTVKHTVKHNNDRRKRHKRSDYEYDFEREFEDLDVREFYDDLD